MARLSGLQRDVLSLYRKCLRACRAKPSETKPNFYIFARKEFERNRGLNKKDFGTIEFLLRKDTICKKISELHCYPWRLQWLAPQVQKRRRIVVWINGLDHHICAPSKFSSKAPNASQPCLSSFLRRPQNPVQSLESARC
ncbi:hypothetical protein BTJ68_01868 [Hortaea werneckii EXF-2000]|uniref:Complex 1 LYR protein domain-containing protein n=1 Tax=Hortaea werneckii EXF-2000 TaxID=1157616 RepID=A0A1Z5TP32_HORWE|nr:hypothetical protein BTJ68_01868 [Hortaea werneckii EXF-2000]